MMDEPLSIEAIHVKGINLWAHVGVLEKERSLGQKFLVDFSLWIDLKQAARTDQLSYTADYSLAIKAIQRLSLDIKCLTIEAFGEKILDLLEELYGIVPIRVFLTKCDPPVEGFSGFVAVERKRNFTLFRK